METVYISAQEAADLLGKTRRRVNQLVDKGELSAKRIGNSNAIDRASVLKLKRAQKNGKPKGKR